MKKVLYGVFMAFFAVMTMGAIQSCTDDLTDVKGDLNQTKYDLDGLKQQVANLEPRVGTLEASMKDVLEQKIPALQAAVAQNAADIVAVRTYAEALGLKVDGLETRLTDAETKLATMKAWMDVYGKYVEDMKAYDLLEKVKGLEQTVATLEPKVTKLYDEVFKEGGLKDQVADLDERVDNLEADFLKLQAQVDQLTERVNKLITDILIQATDSPVFGNFSLPIGIQSNILFGWYFHNGNNVAIDFPSNDDAIAYDGNGPGYPQFNSATGSVSIADGKVYANLGKVYMTINPFGHNVIDDKTFTFETSNGEALPFEFKPVESEEKLMFGYNNNTRVAENGFYEQEIIWEDAEEAAIEAADVKINDDLKSAVKAILEDRTKRTALNLVKAVWNQVNGTFPRYAVRADWTATDKDGVEQKYAVLSKYDLGIATAEPLGFKFLLGHGQITGHRLPYFNHQFANLIDRIKRSGRLDFDLTGVINKDKIKFNVSLENVQVSVNMPKIKVSVTVAGQTAPSVGEATNMNEVNEAVKSAVTSALTNAGTTINTQINDQVSKIVDDIVADIQNTINSKIDSVLDKIEAKGEPWFQRLDKLVDLYNRAADKINNFLANPNAYLQPCVFYKADGTMGLVSNDANYPTVFVNGGGSAFDLFPSTYTAELVAPVYMKYIKCINDDAVNASCTEYLDKVLKGSVYKIVIPTSAMNSDKTYEFIYQALDYHGNTSTCKFYIKVNK